MIENIKAAAASGAVAVRLRELMAHHAGNVLDKDQRRLRKERIGQGRLAPQVVQIHPQLGGALVSAAFLHRGKRPFDCRELLIHRGDKRLVGRLLTGLGQVVELGANLREPLFQRVDIGARLIDGPDPILHFPVPNNQFPSHRAGKVGEAGDMILYLSVDFGALLLGDAFQPDDRLGRPVRLRAADRIERKRRGGLTLGG